MSTTIHRDGNQVWLEGIDISLLSEKCSSVHAAQATIAQTVGETMSYDYLVGVSSLAFRMQISQENFCPSSPHSFCGFQCVSRSTRALPWHLHIYQVGKADEETIRKVRLEIMDSIHRGVPVQYGEEEDGIIIGYQSDGEEWICYHPHHEKGLKSFIETEWPWGIAIFTERKETLPSPYELAVNALRQAVAMHSTGVKDNYFTGQKAWLEYIERLQRIESLEKEIPAVAVLGNAWIYHCLIQHRECACYYLRVAAGEFPDPAKNRLNHAADLYEQISTQILRDNRQASGDIAPFPWSLKDGRTWSNDMRLSQIHRLRNAMEIENEAISEIEYAIEGIADDLESDLY